MHDLTIKSVIVLDHLATDRDVVGATALDELTVLAPVLPDQVPQSGANYRTHVIDIIAAEERERGAMSEAQARELGARMMDERVANDLTTRDLVYAATWRRSGPTGCAPRTPRPSCRWGRGSCPPASSVTPRTSRSPCR